MDRWLAGDDMWLIRAALIHMGGWKHDIDRDWVFAACRARAGHPDFFVRKAIGWILRDVAWVDPEAVVAFVASAPELPVCRSVRPSRASAGSVGPMAKTIDLRRHFKNDGDALTSEGVAAAVEAGKTLTGRYQLAVSSGAQRATQAVAGLLAGHGKVVAGGVIVDPGLRSAHEARWMELIKEAGADDLDTARALDPDFVASEAASLSDALRRVLDALDDGEAAIVVGHSPTNEAAVLGLTGQVIAPLAKGTGVRIVAGEEGISVTPLR